MQGLNFHHLASCFGSQSWMSKDSVRFHSLEQWKTTIQKFKLNSMLWKILGNHLKRVHRRINWGKNHRVWMEGTPTPYILPWFSYRQISFISQNDILSLSKFYSEAYHKFFVSTVISSHIMTVLAYSLALISWLCSQRKQKIPGFD